jgi:PAS domain S-box-containing protein
VEPTRILVVEDEPMVQEFLKVALTSSGYEVLAAVRTGEEAVKQTQEIRPDIILMDIVLAGEMDGIQASQIIHSKIDVPIIYLTSHGEPDKMERAKKTFPFSYLFKPVTSRDLQFAIEMALYRHEMERRLRVSEDRYRAVVESQTEMVCRISFEGTLTFVNSAFHRCFDLQPEDAVGQSLWLYVPELERKFLDADTQTQSPCVIEHPVEVAGKTKWLVWNISHITDQEDRPGEFQLVGHDVTDRKRAEDALQKAHDELEERVKERTAQLTKANTSLQKERNALRESEERFRAVFESAQDYIYLKDINSGYLSINPAAEAFLGKSASEVAGLTDTDLFGPEVAARLVQVDRRVLKGEAVEEEHILRFEEEEYAFLTTRVPLTDFNGKVTGMCVISRDITGRKGVPTPTHTVQGEALSPAMKATVKLASLAAQTDSIVLLRGESGVGKDYLARFIHDQSSRSAGPFYSINCAAVAENIAESELFGHVSGAFTGAGKRKRGLLELAEGGTLLLNEIGDLPTPLQAKLLTFLDTRSFTRVGGTETVTVNARLIAATNRDLKREAAEGRFREDLLYRISVFPIEIPPLRERKEDLALLAEQIIANIAAELQLSFVPEIDSGTLDLLSRYTWPGNVRELRNVLERGLILSRGERLDLDDPASNESNKDDWRWTTTFPPRVSLDDVVDDLIRSMVEEALQRSNGMKQEAARLLGISRHTLRRRMLAVGADDQKELPD